MPGHAYRLMHEICRSHRRDSCTYVLAVVVVGIVGSRRTERVVDEVPPKSVVSAASDVGCCAADVDQLPFWRGPRDCPVDNEECYIVRFVHMAKLYGKRQS